MRVSKAQTALPLSVKRALKKLGADISAARRRRGISVALLAERAFIDPRSVARIERGDAGVSMGIYATVLFTLGLIDKLGDLADVANDPVGRTLADEQLPKRVRAASAPLGSVKRGT